ncbi:putative mannose-1-phosphate guanylyltransferase 1 [Iris pallida]|uniref:Mannose-1-phosphate guanylyltransferase 1 n=1 Tax=Iris pallida TaxID=29817 RepID=A0AAX6DWD0_IRIPA|nr:putative mannose-1-phosphate guanylyltransferase 1 [Iris pallida]
MPIYLLNPSVVDRIELRPTSIEKESSLGLRRTGAIRHGPSRVLDGHRAAAGLHRGAEALPGLSAEEGEEELLLLGVISLRRTHRGERVGPRDREDRRRVPHRTGRRGRPRLRGRVRGEAVDVHGDAGGEDQEARLRVEQHRRVALDRRPVGSGGEHDHPGRGRARVRRDIQQRRRCSSPQGDQVEHPEA